LNELKTAQTALDALVVEERNLVLRAAEDGVVLELDRDLRPGSWVSLRTQVALVGSEKATLAGYVSEADVEAIDLGTSGVFVPEDIGEPNIPVRVVRIDRSGISAIGQPELASTFGGAIKSKMVSGQLMAARNYFYIEFTPVTSGKSAPGQVVVGTVLLSAAPRSLGLRVLRGIASVMIKEAAF
jgi:putative peptide zinc metalloprotease protein